MLREVLTLFGFFRGLQVYSFLFTLLFFVSQQSSLANAQEATTLEPNKTVERELAVEQKHAYKITLAAKQYLHVTVEQKGIDVVITLFDPAGAAIIEVDSPNGRTGLEEIKAAFENAGEYRLEIKAMEKGAPAGFYAARVAEMREAKTEDLKRFRANQIQKEALKLRDQVRTGASIRQAIPMFEESARLTGELGDKKDQGIATHDIALARQLIGEFDGAIEIYKRAIQISHDAGDFKTEGTSINNIGFIYNRLADYQNALFYFHRSLEVYNQANLEPNTTLPLANLGGIYKTLGELERSIDYYTRALANARKYNQRNNESAVLLNLATVYTDAGDYQKGLDAQLQILPYWRAQRNKQGEELCLGYIADNYFYLNDYQNALDYYNQQYKLSEPNDLTGMVRALFGIGRTYSRLGNTEKALENLNKSLSMFRQDSKSSSLALFWIAQTERKAGRFAEAEANFKKTVELIESIRNRISAQDLRTSFFSNSSREIYDAYISFLMQRNKQEPNKGYDRQAFDISEKARARSLLELLAASRVDIRQGVDAALLEREANIRKQLVDKTAQLSRLILTKATEDKITAAKNDYEKTEEELQQTEAQIRKASPRYAALTQSQTVSLEETQTSLLDKDTALLEYSLGETNSFLWVVTSDSIQTFELPARKEIEKASRNVYELLTARNRIIKFETVEEKRARSAKADAELPKALASLSEMILSPAAKTLTKKRLLIVPDGALFYVPFAALPKTGGQPLIAGSEIVNLPSASTLAVLRKDLQGREPATKAIAIFADPVFGKEDDRYKTILAKTNNATKPSSDLVATTRGVELSDFSDLTRATEDVRGENFTLSRLPFTRKEADAIASIVSSTENKTSLDFSANRKAALDPELSQYRIIHFATHSFISTAHPEVSGVVLSLIDENGKEQNGFIRASDVYNLKLPADLIVLSGCKTGLGKEIRGEGLVGMTQSFMYAGAERIAVSLWDVNDEATSELMTRFYRGMFKEKLSAAAALKQAQVSMLKDKRWSSPYYWASFVLQGEPR